MFGLSTELITKGKLATVKRFERSCGATSVGGGVTSHTVDSVKSDTCESSKGGKTRQVIHVKVPYSHPHNSNPKANPNLPHRHPYLTMNYMPTNVSFYRLSC